jgi:cyanophycinase
VKKLKHVSSPIESTMNKQVAPLYTNLYEQFSVLLACLFFTMLLSSLSGCIAPPINETHSIDTGLSGDVSNIIIGGGMLNCSSMSENKSTDSNGKNHCTKPWSEILQYDPAFADLNVEDISFGLTISGAKFTYSVDVEKIQKLSELPETFISQQTKQKLIEKLRTLVSKEDATSLTGNALHKSGLKQLTWTEFAALLDLAKAGSAIPPLTISALRHLFVEKNESLRSPRLQQARSVMFLDNQASKTIYQTFIDAARSKAAANRGATRPRIGLVTASAENPFNDRDIYYYALKSAGADVFWLPLDGGMRTAIDTQLCEFAPIFYADYATRGSSREYFHMDKIYPDLSTQQIQFCKNAAKELDENLHKLDGIFFTGGNQTRHLESFVSTIKTSEPHPTRVISKQLTILQNRYQQGKLVVAGSSAGDAIQAGGNWKGKPIPMIGGGDSMRVLHSGFAQGGEAKPENAQAKGTSYANGGLGFFEFGVLDSHFSIRSREGRLIRLVSDSGVDYGFGVDENTALIVNAKNQYGTTAMSIIGAGGVFIVDARTAQSKAAADAPFHIENVLIHYLTEGDSVEIDRLGALTVALSSDKKQLPANAHAPKAIGHKLQESGGYGFLKLLQRMGETGAESALGSVIQNSKPNATRFSVSLARMPDSEFRKSKEEKISYTQVQLAIRPCSDGCVEQPELNK